VPVSGFKPAALDFRVAPVCRSGPTISQCWAHARVRRDRINSGNVTLRIGGRLHHIGLGRTFDRASILMLIDDLDVRVIHAATGEIIRTLTIDPNRTYHGTGKPTGGPKGRRKTNRTGP
jgi:hypothetical protein